MSYTQMYNPTDSPVVIDADGRIIGGGDWGVVDLEEEHTQRAIDRDALVEFGPDAATRATGRAKEAIESAREFNRRADAFIDVPDARLAELAGVSVEDLKDGRRRERVMRRLTRDLSIDRPDPPEPDKPEPGPPKKSTDKSSDGDDEED